MSDEANIVQELSRELKRDKFLLFVKKHLTLIVICLAVIFIGSLSFGVYKYYYNKKLQKLAFQYFVAGTIYLDNPDKQESINLVRKDFESTQVPVYKLLFGLRLSNLFVQNNDIESAKSTLSQLVNNNKIPTYLSDVVRLNLANLELLGASMNNKPIGEDIEKKVESILNPVAINAQSQYSDLAKEILSTSYLRKGDYKTYYKKLLEINSSPESGQAMKARVNEMLYIVGSQLKPEDRK